MSTRCELSVCATKLIGCCTVAAVTVSTTTCGAGRSAGGFSLEQPAAMPAATRSAMRAFMRPNASTPLLWERALAEERRRVRIGLAEPLCVHGAELRRGVDPAQRPVHGETSVLVSASQRDSHRRDREAALEKHEVAAFRVALGGVEQQEPVAEEHARLA